MPETLDWALWRLVTSERISSGMAEIRDTWTMLDVLDAHDALDLHEEAEARAHRKANAQSKR